MRLGRNMGTISRLLSTTPATGPLVPSFLPHHCSLTSAQPMFRRGTYLHNMAAGSKGILHRFCVASASPLGPGDTQSEMSEIFLHFRTQNRFLQVEKCLLKFLVVVSMCDTQLSITETEFIHAVPNTLQLLVWAPCPWLDQPAAFLAPIRAGIRRRRSRHSVSSDEELIQQHCFGCFVPGE